MQTAPSSTSNSGAIDPSAVHWDAPAPEPAAAAPSVASEGTPKASDVTWNQPVARDPLHMEMAPTGYPANPQALRSELSAQADVGKGALRGAIERTSAVPLLFGDAATAAGNLIGDVVSWATGIPRGNVELPSQTLRGVLDKTIGKPKTAGGRIAETGMAVLGPTGARPLEDAVFSLTPSQMAEHFVTGKPIPVREQAMLNGSASGFKFSPAQMRKAHIGKLLAGLVGKTRTEEENSIANLKRVQDVAADNFGLPKGTELTDEALDGVAAPADAVYQEVADLGVIATGKEYADEITRLGSPGHEVEEDFPENTPQAVTNLRSSMNQPQFRGRSALDKMKQLRRDSRMNFRSAFSHGSADTEKLSLAMAQHDGAKALENELERAAQRSGKPDLMQRFKRARKLLAQVNAVRDATVLGKLSARSLANQWARGVQLTGNLRTIAEAALASPGDFLDVKRGPLGPFTSFDAWIMAGALLNAAGEEYEGRHGMQFSMGAGLLSITRPGVRALLRSTPVQRVMFGQVIGPAMRAVGGAMERNPGAVSSAVLQLEDATGAAKK